MKMHKLLEQLAKGGFHYEKLPQPKGFFPAYKVENKSKTKSALLLAIENEVADGAFRALVEQLEGDL